MAALVSVKGATVSTVLQQVLLPRVIVFDGIVLYTFLILVSKPPE